MSARGAAARLALALALAPRATAAPGGSRPQDRHSASLLNAIRFLALRTIPDGVTAAA